eukprot:667769-Pleurochrysis_carterae.AAC.4
MSALYAPKGARLEVFRRKGRGVSAAGFSITPFCEDTAAVPSEGMRTRKTENACGRLRASQRAPTHEYACACIRAPVVVGDRAAAALLGELDDVERGRIAGALPAHGQGLSPKRQQLRLQRHATARAAAARLAPAVGAAAVCDSVDAGSAGCTGCRAWVEIACEEDDAVSLSKRYVVIKT